MKKTLLFSAVAFIAMITFNSCSKNKLEGKNAKFTITITGASSNDYVSFSIAGGTTNQSESTVWKINGVTQENQAGITLNEDNFTGTTKTYIIESTKPLLAISSGISAFNHEGAALKINYIAEINGKEVNNENATSNTSNETYIKSFKY